VVVGTLPFRFLLLSTGPWSEFTPLILSLLCRKSQFLQALDGDGVAILHKILPFTLLWFLDMKTIEMGKP
jgi:hypothetical protein